MNRGNARLGSLALVAVGLMLTLTGCATAAKPAAAPADPASAIRSAAASDYPGWRAVGGVGPSRSSVGVGPDAPLTREDAAVALQSPDSSMRVLAWYSRSTSGLNVAPQSDWFNPDELYVGDSWRSETARGLYAQMRRDHPNEILLGAYPDRGTGRRGLWHVGFYTEKSVGSAFSFIRGDHLYSNTNGIWRMEKADSGSDNPWNIAGAVRKTRQ